jgi:hypothetical protein
MSKDKIDLSSITLIDHTALGEENWQDYSITVDAKDIVNFSDDLNYDFSDVGMVYNDSHINGKMSLTGERADIEINGKSLKDAITNIEERLAILNINPELEAEFAELKQLGEQYRTLEKQLLDKKQVWDKLQGAEGD